MISYTIDQSILNPPAIPSIKNINVIENKIADEYNEKIVKYSDNIQKVNKIKNIEEISVYLFRFSENSLDTNYVKKAINISKFPIDQLKKISDELFESYYPDPDFSNGKKKKCYLLEDRFDFEELKYKNASIEPALQNQNIYTSEDVERITKIGILNYYVYKDFSKHFLIKDEAGEYSIDCTKLRFLLNKLPQKEENIKLNIQVLNITDINHNNNLQFNTVDKAYKHAKNEFSDYLVFGKDVEKGIETIRVSAGPPERIFYYLRTLKEFCEYKRKIKTNFPDDYLLKSLGCDCSYEKPEHMRDKRAQDERMYDDGNNKKKLFQLHLKPITYNQYKEIGNKTGTTRIYILWDENIKKVIIGWIGKHPYLPPKTPLSPSEIRHYTY